MVETPSCALCRRTGEARVFVGAYAFCNVCLSKIGRFLCEGPLPAVEGIWRAPPRELARRALTDIVNAEVAKIRHAVPETHPRLESAIAGFKADLSPAPLQRNESGNPLAHLDLAVTYAAMGMSDESLAEAGAALSASQQLGERAHEAAEIVLGRGAFRLTVPETLENLRALLFPA